MSQCSAIQLSHSMNPLALLPWHLGHCLIDSAIPLISACTRTHRDFPRHHMRFFSLRQKACYQDRASATAPLLNPSISRLPDPISPQGELRSRKFLHDRLSTITLTQFDTSTAVSRIRKQLCLPCPAYISSKNSGSTPTPPPRNDSHFPPASTRLVPMVPHLPLPPR